MKSNDDLENLSNSSWIDNGDLEFISDYKKYQLGNDYNKMEEKNGQ